MMSVLVANFIGKDKLTWYLLGYSIETVKYITVN